MFQAAIILGFADIAQRSRAAGGAYVGFCRCQIFEKQAQSVFQVRLDQGAIWRDLFTMKVEELCVVPEAEVLDLQVFHGEGC